MHPILFQTDVFVLYTLWLLFAIAIVASAYTLIKLSIKNGLKIQFFSENAWKLIFWGLIGSRIAFILFNYQNYFYEINLDAFFRLFYIWDKGLSLWGGLLLALIQFYYICKKSDQSFWKWMDVIVPSIIVGLAISHLGAFFDGINYGRETSLPWGVNFESPAIKYAVPIHPTQIYAFLYSSLVVACLILLNHVEKVKNIEPPGFLGILGLASYSFFRFLEDFIRGDDTLLIFDIRVSQIVALVIFVSTLGFFYLRYSKQFQKGSLRSKHIDLNP